MRDEEIFQELYNSEINFSVSCFWDAGFEVGIGDDMNGWREVGQVDTWAEVAPWLKKAAIESWPKSEFAKKVAANA